MTQTSKGQALAVTAGLMVLFAMLGVAAVQMSGTQGQTAVLSLNTTQAFWAAEGGLQLAKASGCPSTELTGSLGSGTYDVKRSGASSPYTLTSTGTVSSVAVIKQKLQSLCTVTLNSLFTQSILGVTSVTIGNSANAIDSYDSSVGTYGGKNVSNSALIASNGSAASSIDLGNNKIAGVQTVTNAKVTVYPVSIPDLVWNTSNVPSLNNLSGSTTLNSGNYKYSSVLVNSNGVLTISGNVVLWVTGTFTLADKAELYISSGSSLVLYADGNVTSTNTSKNAAYGFVNSTLIPLNLMIKSRYNMTISIDNNENFYGVIYAPLATVTLQNNDSVFGAVVGNVVNAGNNLAIHYDQAAGKIHDDNPSNTVSSYALSNWAQLP